MAAAAPLHGSECRVVDPDNPGADSRQSVLSLGTRTQGCQQLSAASSMQQGAVGDTSACHRCLLLGGRYCVPLATLAAQRPQLAPAPRSGPRL